jgi:hypothetical protein
MINNNKLNELIRMVEFINPNKLKDLSFIRYPNYEHSNADKLYALLAKEGYKDEEELVNIFFEHKKNKRGYFNRLKRNLREKLINTIFLVNLNQSKNSNISVAYYTSYKYAAASKILLGQKMRNISVSIAKEALKIAEKYEFTDINLTICRDLRVHYGNILGNSRKFEIYNKKVTYYSNLLLWELKAEEYFSDIVLNFPTSSAAQSELTTMVIKYSDELEKVLEKYNSYRLNLVSYTLLAMRYEITLDYQNTIVTCNRALEYFKKKKHLSNKVAKFTFYFRKISSLVLTGYLQEARELTNECLLLENSGKHNWYKLQNYRFIIAMHLRDYQTAFNVYQEAISNKAFSKQYTDIKETWLINEAYIYFLYLKKAIDAKLNERLKKFRLNKFLNNVPSYSKDKRGNNIAILILQVLFLLHNKEYGKIIDRTEALRTYTHRYLRKDETFRSNCFIKMLMRLPTAHFHKSAVIRKTEELYKKLSSVSVLNNQSAEVEAVPYEVLWEFVLSSLENKIR